MSCDCEYPSVYHAKVVTTRKPHKCCECGNLIDRGNQAEKVDALWDGEFQTIYTCLDCVGVRDRVKQEFADRDDCLCSHGELFDFLWQSDLLWDEDEIEEEASSWVPDYDGVIQGANFVIGVKVDWLQWQDGKLRLTETMHSSLPITR